MMLAPFVVFLIPIVAILMVFGTAMLAILVAFLKRRHMFALYHQERMAAIEKGIELPPLPQDFFQEDGAKPKRPASHASLLWGLILVATGVTLYFPLHLVLMRVAGEADEAWFALVPVGIGLACLIYYAVVGRKAALKLDQTAAPSSPTPTTTKTN